MGSRVGRRTVDHGSSTDEGHPPPNCRRQDGRGGVASGSGQYPDDQTSNPHRISTSHTYLVLRYVTTSPPSVVYYVTRREVNMTCVPSTMRFRRCKRLLVSRPTAFGAGDYKGLHFSPSQLYSCPGVCRWAVRGVGYAVRPLRFTAVGASSQAPANIGCVWFECVCACMRGVTGCYVPDGARARYAPPSGYDPPE